EAGGVASAPADVELGVWGGVDGVAESVRGVGAAGVGVEEDANAHGARGIRGRALVTLYSALYRSRAHPIPPRPYDSACSLVSRGRRAPPRGVPLSRHPRGRAVALGERGRARARVCQRVHPADPLRLHASALVPDPRALLARAQRGAFLGGLGGRGWFGGGGCPDGARGVRRVPPHGRRDQPVLRGTPPGQHGTATYRV